MITEEYYKEILQQYPEYITKDQMYRICHVSKKTCLHLLESGTVPNIDSGKKTRRFKIRTVDVIQFLKERNDCPEMHKDSYGVNRGEGSEKVFAEKDFGKIRSFYEKQLKNYPDVMTVDQVAQFTGYCKNSVSGWCSKEKLQSFFIRQRFWIPKKSLLDFLISRYFMGIAVKSKRHQEFNQQICVLLKK